MSSGLAVVAALALLFAALGLMLWHRAQTRVARERVTRFVESRVAAAGYGAAASVPNAPNAPKAHNAHSAASASNAQTPARAAADPDSWRMRAATAFEHAMSRAGIANARKPALLIAFVTLTACLWAGLLGGVLAALTVMAMVSVLVAFVLSLRMQRRRARLVAQLPSFLDGIVRLVVLGNSVPAAFQAALQTTEMPLRECLDRVSRMLRTGVEIDRALHQVAQVYHANELDLVGAVLRLSVRYGGRADVMLERMATFMRDLDQAQRELVAMSAETRMSAWVLALLPVGIVGFLILVNPKYFAAMWYDDGGRHLVYGALVLQVVGAYLLYRLTRLRSTL
ncbi:type II secretion system F family protein [Paraburkholderia acidipaludis]|uniref:type II secretion system F family protein n=1 Tax=Paraburkholderia acidipaludis TaxID=660537 RepID=UPI0004866C31|nr:type II secretion system F family protein [Paraburkholderia acidipaludis]